jgi:hypothetical protein
MHTSTSGKMSNRQDSWTHLDAHAMGYEDHTCMEVSVRLVDFQRQVYW